MSVNAKLARVNSRHPLSGGRDLFHEEVRFKLTKAAPEISEISGSHLFEADFADKSRGPRILTGERKLGMLI